MLQQYSYLCIRLGKPDSVIGLSISPFKSIWDSIGGAANTAGNAVFSGIRDVGDLGSEAAAAVTGNDQAYQNASNAIQSNNSNLSGQNFGQRALNDAKQFVAPLEQGYNTVSAGVQGLGGIAGYGLNSAFGTGQQANSYLQGAQSGMDSTLDNGLGGVGGFVSSKNSKLNDGSFGSIKKSFLAPVAKGVGGIAPYFAPGVGEGLGLAARVGADAVLQGGVGAGSSIAQQYGNGQPINYSDAAKAGLTNAVISAGMHGAKAGVGELTPSIKAVSADYQPGSDVVPDSNGGVSSSGEQMTPGTEPHLPQPQTGEYSSTSLDTPTQKFSVTTGQDGKPLIMHGDQPLISSQESLPSGETSTQPSYTAGQSVGQGSPTLPQQEFQQRTEAQMPQAQSGLPEPSLTNVESRASESPYSIENNYTYNTPNVKPGELNGRLEDLNAPADSLKELAPESKGMDYTKVEGSQKELDNTITSTAQMLKGIDDSMSSGMKQTTADGGYIRTSEHTPFYRNYFAENGHAPSMAAWKEYAQEYMQGKMHEVGDAEGETYKDLFKRAETEAELKHNQIADRQSGYAKVRVRAPDGMKRQVKGMTDAQIDKYKSPEWQNNSETGSKLSAYAAQLKDANRVLKVQRQAAKGLKSVQELNEHNANNIPLMLRQRRLQGLVQQYSEKYEGTKQALADKYGDTVLYKNGKTPKGPVNPGVSGSDAGATVRVSSSPSLAKISDPSVVAKEALDDSWQYKPENEVKAYNGPNMNEGAFSPADRAEMDKQIAMPQPESDSTALPIKRNLDGDEAVHNVLEGNGTIEDAVNEYQRVTGEDRATAEKAVDDNIDLGQIDTTATQSRNPMFGKLENEKPTNSDGVLAQQRGQGRALDVLNDTFTDAYHKLGSEDKALIENSRGRTNAELVAQAKNPQQLFDALKSMDDLQDTMHEMQRQSGSPALYRNNYRAGLHTQNVIDEDIHDPNTAPNQMQDSLDRINGRDRPRNINDYSDIPGDRERQHANIYEDVQHDINFAKGFTRDRSLARGLNDAYGNDATVFGAPDSAHNTALYPGSKVFTTPEIAKGWQKIAPTKVEENRFKSIAMKPLRSATSGVIQATVINPLIHGRNLLTQAFEAAGATSHFGIDGGAKFLGHLTQNVSKSDLFDFYREGNHAPTYKGADQGIISKLTHGVTDVNKNAMASIDLHMRVALWKTLRNEGMDAETVRQRINSFLGDEKSMSKSTQDFGLFFHYFKTQLGSLGQVGKDVAHGQTGSLVNLAVAAAAVYGLDKAAGAITGNPNANIGTPGNLSIIKDAYKFGQNVSKGHYLQSLGTVTNHINPILKEGISQGLNRDLTFGNTLSPNNTLRERLTHAAGLTPETQGVANAMNNKKVPLESILNAAGVNTPHAKGYQAAPNIDALNEPNAKAGNGLAQQQAYFDNIEQAKNSLSSGVDKRTSDEFNAYLDRNGKMNSDGTITHYQLTDSEKKAQAQDLFGNDKLRQVVNTYQNGQNNKDPLYKLSDDQQKVYYQYESKGADDPQRTVLLDRNPFLKQLQDDRSTYFAANVVQGNSINPGNPTYPVFSSDTQSKLDQITQLSAVATKTQDQKDQETALYADPGVKAAQQSIHEYINATRSATGDLPLKGAPQVDAETQQAYQTYLALPSHDGAKGGSPERAAWIKSNPDVYAKIQDFLAQESLYKLDKNASLDTFEGQTPNQKELAAAESLGKYDIAKGTDAAGNINYVINPGLARNGGSSNGFTYKASSTAGGSGSGSGGGNGGFFSQSGKTNALGENLRTTVGYDTRHNKTVKIISPGKMQDARGLFQQTSNYAKLKGRTLHIRSPRVTVNSKG